MLLVEWQPQARESLLEILDYLGDHIAIVEILHARQEYP
jgi:plasmid stabilization system protein ParE